MGGPLAALQRWGGTKNEPNLLKNRVDDANDRLITDQALGVAHQNCKSFAASESGKRWEEPG
jgi:hypothetical protein